MKQSISISRNEFNVELDYHSTISISTAFHFPGGILMYGSLLLFESEFLHIVAITFTALIFTELLMIGLTVRSWHWLMLVAEFFSFGLYVTSLALLPSIFGKFEFFVCRFL